MEYADPRVALDALIAESGDSYAALSRMLGRNPAYLQQYVKRGSPRILPERERAMLARYFGVAQSRLGAAPENTGMVAVPALAVVATAGAGGLLADEDRSVARYFDPERLRALGVEAQNASIIEVQGDSMEPTLFAGDMILIDGASRRITRRGGLFVIRMDDAVMVKRLRLERGEPAVLSDNPAYPPVRDRPFSIIGRVAWLERVPR